jgi:hypothetical protein
MAVARAQAPVPGRSLAMDAHLADPFAELRQEQLVGHGDAELAPLHGFGAFVGGFELRVHPLVSQEAGAILGDAVAAHQADGFAHHAARRGRCSTACRPGRGRWPPNQQRVLHQRRRRPVRAACRPGTRSRPASAPCAWPSSRRAAGDAARGQDLHLLLLERVQLVEQCARLRSPATRWLRRWPTRPPGGAPRPPSVAGPVRSAASRAGDGAAAEAVALRSGSPARRPRAAWPRS